MTPIKGVVPQDYGRPTTYLITIPTPIKASGRKERMLRSSSYNSLCFLFLVYQKLTAPIIFYIGSGTKGEMEFDVPGLVDSGRNG